MDSENKKNLQNDTWRLHQLGKTLSNPKHPYCHFSTGNLETLKEEPTKKGINVRDEFLKFHDKFYSSNVMKLVVLGREDLDTLERWVVELFEGVKNKDLPDPRFEGQPFTEEQLLVCSPLDLIHLGLLTSCSDAIFCQTCYGYSILRHYFPVP